MSTLQNHSNFIQPELTDLYGPRMALGYWKNDVHMVPATFDVFFRKHAQGQYTAGAGLDEVMALVDNYKITSDYTDFISKQLPSNTPLEFYHWLKSVDLRGMEIFAVKPRIVHPRVPLMRITGPVGIAQMLETPILNLIGYPSMVATRAARLVQLSRKSKRWVEMMEFGLRRAPGPDGGVTASKYAYVGGFDRTSNVLAAEKHNIPMGGTNAHAYITFFDSLSMIKDDVLVGLDGISRNFIELVLHYKGLLATRTNDSVYRSTNEGELAGMIAYALAFPDMFLTLVDSYNTQTSGLPNYLCVAYALKHCGYEPKGIRIDSDDLAYLSKEARKFFSVAAQALETENVQIRRHHISGSNDIDENHLAKMIAAEHEFDSLGIGTYLVNPPPMGVVYKLVDVNGSPRMKAVFSKMILPGKKAAYRLYGGKDNRSLDDLITCLDEPAPVVGERVLARDPLKETERVYIRPAEVEPLLECVWNGQLQYTPDLQADRRRIEVDLVRLRDDHKDQTSDAPYKVSVSEKLYTLAHQMWAQASPIPEIG